MVNQILPLLSRLIPTGLAVKGLEKINPKIRSFLGGAFGAGYTADQAIDFLREHFETPGNKGIKEKLEAGAQAGTLRPDELAAQKRIRETEEIPNALKNLAVGGAGIAGGLGARQTMASQPEASPAQPRPSVQTPQPEQSPREKSLKRHAEMNQKKKLIDQLTGEFEKEYGPGSDERIQMGTPGGEKSLLLRALQETKRLLGG